MRPSRASPSPRRACRLPQAAEFAVRLAMAAGKPFALVPCCVYAAEFPRRKLRSGEQVRARRPAWAAECPWRAMWVGQAGALFCHCRGDGKVPCRAWPRSQWSQRLTELRPTCRSRALPPHCAPFKARISPSLVFPKALSAAATLADPHPQRLPELVLCPLAPAGP